MICLKSPYPEVKTSKTFDNLRFESSPAAQEKWNKAADFGELCSWALPSSRMALGDDRVAFCCS